MTHTTPTGKTWPTDYSTDTLHAARRVLADATPVTEVRAAIAAIDAELRTRPVKS